MNFLDKSIVIFKTISIFATAFKKVQKRS